MSWVNDLASISGIPAGAATLAVAMYAGCAAAEKAARPEALQDIGRVLKDPSWSRSVRPSAIIERVFVWTFGERHLSLRCIRQSVTATVIFVGVLLSAFLVGWHIDLPGFLRNVENTPVFFAVIMVCGIALDYVALAKTRWLLRISAVHAGRRAPVFLIATDVVISLLLAALAVILYSEFYFRYIREYSSMTTVYAAEQPYLVNNIASHTMIVLLSCQFSTLLTSVWLISVLGSTVVVKALAPVHRFTAWSRLFNARYL